MGKMDRGGEGQGMGEPDNKPENEVVPDNEPDNKEESQAGCTLGMLGRVSFSYSLLTPLSVLNYRLSSMKVIPSGELPGVLP